MNGTASFVLTPSKTRKDQSHRHTHASCIHIDVRARSYLYTAWQGETSRREESADRRDGHNRDTMSLFLGNKENVTWDRPQRPKDVGIRDIEAFPFFSPTSIFIIHTPHYPSVARYRVARTWTMHATKMSARERTSFRPISRRIVTAACWILVALCVSEVSLNIPTYVCTYLGLNHFSFQGNILEKSVGISWNVLGWLMLKSNRLLYFFFTTLDDYYSRVLNKSHAYYDELANFLEFFSVPIKISYATSFSLHN